MRLRRRRLEQIGIVGEEAVLDRIWHGLPAPCRRRRHRRRRSASDARRSDGFAGKRRPLLPVEQRLGVARGKFLGEPAGEGLDLARQCRIGGLALAHDRKEGAQIVRDVARSDQQHALLAQRRQRAAEPVVPFGVAARVDRDLNDRNVGVRKGQQQRRPGAVIIAAAGEARRLQIRLRRAARTPLRQARDRPAPDIAIRRAAAGNRRNRRSCRAPDR